MTIHTFNYYTHCNDIHDTVQWQYIRCNDIHDTVQWHTWYSTMTIHTVQWQYIRCNDSAGGSRGCWCLVHPLSQLLIQFISYKQQVWHQTCSCMYTYILCTDTVDHTLRRWFSTIENSQCRQWIVRAYGRYDQRHICPRRYVLNLLLSYFCTLFLT